MKSLETAVVPAAFSGLVDVKAGAPAHTGSAKTANVTLPVGGGAPAVGVKVAVSWNEEPRPVAAGETRVEIGAAAMFTTTFSPGSPHPVATPL